MKPESQKEILKLENAISTLDSNWQEKQEAFKSQVSGSTELTTKSTNYALITIFLLFIGVLTGNFLFSKITVFSFLQWFLLILLSFYAAYTFYSKSLEYEEQKKAYLNERDTLLSQIEEIKNSNAND